MTADDLAAVTMLSVTVPPRAAIRILDTERDHFRELLGAIRSDIALWAAADEDLGDARVLHAALCGLRGVGWVTAGKLIARKRPRLIPVYDSVVKKALMPNSGAFWAPLRDALADGGKSGPLVDRLRYIRAQARVGDDISELRILDVAIWMRSQGVLTVPSRYPSAEVALLRGTAAG